MALIHTPEDFKKTKCPDFKLPGIFPNNKIHTLQDFANHQPLLIMFICNHCPYVKAIEDRLIQLGHDLKNEDINVVAICSNNESAYPDDSFENLQKRAIEKNYSFTYLHDQDQAIAKKFEAVCTPDFFLYDANLTLAYRGRLDDSWKDLTQVKNRELYQAALELKNKHSISFKQIPSMGCSIKWKN